VPSGGDVALVAIEKTSVQQRYDTFYDGFGGWRRFGGFGESTTTVDDLTDAALAQISTDTLKELAGFHNVLAEHTFGASTSTAVNSLVPNLSWRR
jgi:hypothetical protein